MKAKVAKTHHNSNVIFDSVTSNILLFDSPMTKPLVMIFFTFLIVFLKIEKTNYLFGSNILKMFCLNKLFRRTMLPDIIFGLFSSYLLNHGHENIFHVPCFLSSLSPVSTLSCFPFSYSTFWNTQTMSSRWSRSLIVDI